jgi:hypothetical protein
MNTNKHGTSLCPSATGMWVRAVLDVFDQSVSLPGEISELVVHTSVDNFETLNRTRKCRFCTIAVPPTVK